MWIKVVPRGEGSGGTGFSADLLQLEFLPVEYNYNERIRMKDQLNMSSYSL